MKISIIIPVLDEERRIGQCLAELQGFEEFIVVDGGSRDRTVEIARAAGARVETAPRGRASQMNHGARLVSGDVLLFLHADVSLPEGAAAHIERALADRAVVAGAFRTWHVADDGRRAPWLHLADLRSRLSGLPYGDQALFVRREAFERVGGFPDQPLMEDLELLAASAPAGANRHRARERARVGAALPRASDPRHAAGQRLPAPLPSRCPARLARASLPRHPVISSLLSMRTAQRRRAPWPARKSNLASTRVIR